MNHSSLSGESVTTYLFKNGFWPEEDETDVILAEERINEYKKQTYQTARNSLNDDEIAVYATEEIDFDTMMVKQISYFDPPVILSLSEYAETVRDLHCTAVYWLSKPIPFTEEEGRTYMERYLVPCSLTEAQDIVRRFHRHNAPPIGHKYSLALIERDAEGNENVIGVIMVGHPISRCTMLNEPLTAEILRTCVIPGAGDNACSMLIGAACRVAQAMGYTKIITMTLESETGASLRASGFTIDATGCGGEWTGERARAHRAANPDKKIPIGKKTRWVRYLSQKIVYADFGNDNKSRKNTNI